MEAENSTAHVNELLEAYMRAFPTDFARWNALKEFVETETDLYSRRNGRGHLTASGVVVSDGRILLVEHKFLRVWLQPGGHIEPRETPLLAARREVEEETGVRTSPHRALGDRLPLDIDSHLIPARAEKGEPAHFHHDFRFLLTPEPESMFGLTENEKEVTSIGWFDSQQVSTLRTTSGVERVIKRCQELRLLR